MFNNTLTDLYIKQGMIDPIPSALTLDGDPDDPKSLVLDGKENSQKEEKDRE